MLPQFIPLMRSLNTAVPPRLNLNFLTGDALDPRITFSRGSQATLFDSTGALVYAKHNLLLQSQTFQTTWTVLNSSVSADSAVAPDGTTTADKLVENTANSEHYIEQSATILSSGSCTASVYIKADTRTKARVVFVVGGAGGVFADADLTAGTIGAATAFSGGTAISSAIHNIGNGWYRCVITGIGPAGTAGALRVELLNAAGNRTYTGDGTSGLFIWGAQLNLTAMQGGVTSSLSTYYPTVASAYYAPRFDYSPSTLAAQGLLIEEQRTNSIRNNTMQGAVAGTPGTAPTNWVRDASTTGLSLEVVGTGTDGGITYLDFRVFGTAAAANYYAIYFENAAQIVAANGETWTNSFYLKLAGGSTSGLDPTRFPAACINENTSAGLYVTGQEGIGVTPTSAWQRVSLTRTLNGGATVARVLPFILFRVNNGAAINITLRVGLPQMEQGAFATSVIPTTTTALTRNADVASMTGTNFSSWYNQTEGSLFGQFSLLSSSYTGGVAIDIGAGGAFGATEYIAWNGTAWSLLPNAAPVNVSSSITTTSTAKVIAAIKANDSVISANGLLGPVDTSCAVPASATTLTIGKAGWSGGANYLNGYIQRISYYPVRLPNSTLQALTA